MPKGVDGRGVPCVPLLAPLYADVRPTMPSSLSGLWAWNWADSHRQVQAVNRSSSTIVVKPDDINRDVTPIHRRISKQQGGYLYAYNLRSELDVAGEYFIDKPKATLSFIPPGAATAPGTYSISRLPSVVVATNVSTISFENLEIRYARGAGVVVTDSTDVVIKGCTVSDNGMMALNVTGGERCGIEESEVANNGDAGVVLDGGDRVTLVPSNHYVKNSTSHHNQRWIMMFAPDIMLAGVGQLILDTEVYGSPHFAVFFQGNDHVLSGSHVHDAGRQCSDCAAFYSGREWTYRGSKVVHTTFSNLTTIFPYAHGPPSAIYLDDQLSSVKIDHCFFDDVDGRVMLLGGGRHNEFTNNVVKQTKSVSQSLGMDARGGLGSKCCVAGRLPYSFLSRIPYNTSATWKAAYPGELARFDRISFHSLPFEAIDSVRLACPVG